MLRLIFSLLPASMVSALAAESANPPRDPSYKMVWADEFDKNGPPDPSKWQSEEGFERNGELQWYQAANSICQDGCLILEARKEQVKNPHFEKNSPNWKKNRDFAHYTSGSLITTARNEWSSGRYEVRALSKPSPEHQSILSPAPIVSVSISPSAPREATRHKPRSPSATKWIMSGSTRNNTFITSIVLMEAFPNP